jgi:hypothetical protein
MADLPAFPKVSAPSQGLASNIRSRLTSQGYQVHEIWEGDQGSLWASVAPPGYYGTGAITINVSSSNPEEIGSVRGGSAELLGIDNKTTIAQQIESGRFKGQLTERQRQLVLQQAGQQAFQQAKEARYSGIRYDILGQPMSSMYSQEEIDAKQRPKQQSQQSLITLLQNQN